MSRIDDEALDWFVRRTDGLAAADEARFQQWLAAHAEHAHAYGQWQQDWHELDAMPAAALHRLRQGIPSTQPAASRRPTQDRGAWHRLVAWIALPRTLVTGAGLALLLVCGLTGFLWWQPLHSATYIAANDKRIDTLLADKSRLQLAEGSRATATMYRTRREVELAQGRARFEISPDPARPLTVRAGALRITVVGTRFTVHHTTGPRGPGVRIAVEEGKVKVARAGWFVSSGDTVNLVAGQAIDGAADGTLGPVAPLLPADLAAWHERRVSFDNATLAQVLGEFGKFGDTRLIVRDPAVAALRVTGTFDLLRPDRFAQLLPQALPVRLAQAGGHTEIRAR